jgi:PAS domain S-box-containing protein
METTKLSEETVYVVGSETSRRSELVGLIAKLGYAVESESSWESAAARFEVLAAHVVIIDVESAQGVSLAGEIRALSAETIIMTVCSRENLIPIMEQLKHLVDDFLTFPLTPVAMEISLARGDRMVRLMRDVKTTCSNDRTSQTCQNVAREVENERFLAVRQMVEKISAFISEVTTGAHGDLSFYNELPYFIAVHSPGCRLLAANSVYQKYLGNRLYENSWDIYVGKRATRSACPVGRTAGTGNVQTTRALVRYKSGAKVPVLVHTAPIYDNEGEVALVLEVFAGTQEIEQLARQIRTTQQRYRQLFDAVPSFAVVLDRHYTMTAINRKFKRTFGDHVGKKFFDVFRPAAFPAYRGPLSQTYRDGQAHQGEIVFTGPDGQAYTMMAWTNPICTPTGKMMQVLVIFTDISELRQLKDNLSSLGLMVGTVSHDLKGFLTGLDSGLYQIDKGFYRNDPGRIEQGLDTARLMVDRIRRMVLDVLFSAKERNLERQELEVLEFSGELVTAMEQHIRSADIEFDYDFSLCAGKFRVDKDLLRTALTNIIENAVEACLEDDSQQHHKIQFNVLSRKSSVIFSIKDNGPGLPEDSTKRIFSLFYSSKGRKGTGLGMFITEKVIKKHGGRIAVASEPEQGTTFTVELPR